jgi:hypothetical protein
MSRIPVFIALVLSPLLPATALSEDAQSILEKVREKKIERAAGVKNYTIIQSTNDIRTILYYERFETDDGTPAFRMVPITEIARRLSEEAGAPPPSALDIERMAQAVDMSRPMLSSALEQGMREAGSTGLPMGPAAGLDMRGMVDQYSDFLNAAAESARNESDGTAEAQTEIDHMAEFAETAKLVGRETIDGKSAFLLRADKLNRALEGGNDQFTLQTVSLWIDAEEYVPLRLKMDGIAKSGKKSQPMTIEKLDRKYSSIDGKLYEPHEQVMRLAGVLSPEEEAKIKEAQVKLAEFQKQMEAMPTAQRDMIMKRMGPQMKMMERMASGGGIEVVTEVHEIRVNAGMPTQEDLQKLVSNPINGLN